MELKCPSCKKRFNVPDNVFSDSGSEFTCPSCDSNFTAFRSGLTLRSNIPSRGISSGGTSANNPFMSEVPREFTQEGPKDERIDNLPELPTGEEILGTYRVEEVIGGGAFGKVYRATNINTNSKVAIKAIPSYENVEKVLETLVGEYNAQLKIKNQENIIRSESPQKFSYENLDWVILPMELGEKTMRDWLGEVDISSLERQKQGIDLFKETCKGIEAIHRAGLVHLDLKPENILLVKEEDKYRVKIADFGLTRGMGKLAELRPELLQDGVGTPAYMAPEQIESAHWKDVTKSADIYALGTILYEILDGNLPFSGSVNQIKEKKLKGVSPQKLTGQLEKWWQIIEGCFRISVEERYSSVEKILADVGRLQLGATLSSDVACPECEHINVDSNKRFCEKCNNDLSDLFESCSKCARMVRIDVEICPGCGHSIGSERLYKIRTEKVENLRDEDPVEAIELMEQMIKDGYGVGDKEYSLIKDLRIKQEQISKHIEQANNPSILNEPTKALEHWKEIIKIIPKHKIATSNIKKLEEQIRRLKEVNEKTEQLIDKAEYDKAQQILEKAIEELPNKELLRKQLITLLDKKEKYEILIEELESFYSKKILNKALEKTEAALKIAARSEKVLEIKKTIEKSIKSSSEYESQIKTNLTLANFEDALANIVKIESIQSDFIDIEKLKVDISSIRDKYFESIKNIESEIKNGDLLKAENYVEKALDICPQSKELKEKKAFVLKNKEMVQKLIISVEKDLNKANFTEAMKSLDQIIILWLKNSKIEKLKSDFIDKKDKYETSLKESIALQNEGLIDKAIEKMILASKICSDSEVAKTKLSQLNKIKNNVEKLFSDIDGLLQEADFAKIESNIKEVEKIWSKNSNIINYKNKCEKLKKEYSELVAKCENSLENKDLSNASEMGRDLIKNFPRSKEVQNLKTKIDNQKKQAENHIETGFSTIKKANFEEAQRQLSFAKNIWKNHDKLSSLENTISKTKVEYNNFIEQIKSYLTKSNFNQSKNALNSALSLCPSSSELASLKSSIELAEQEFKIKKRKQENFIKSALRWSGLIGPGVVGIIIFLSKDMSVIIPLLGVKIPGILIGIIIIGLLILAGKMHKKRFTNTWGKLISISIVEYDDKINLIFLYSIIIFIVAFVSTVFGPFIGLLVSIGIYYHSSSMR